MAINRYNINTKKLRTNVGTPVHGKLDFNLCLCITAIDNFYSRAIYHKVIYNINYTIDSKT